MRNFIFEFPQSTAVALGIKTDGLLLLDYFYKFFQDGRARSVTVGNEKYYFIRYSKILSDLPILGSERSLQRLIAGLDKARLIKRHLKDNRDLHIFIDWEKFGQETPPPRQSGAVAVTEGYGFGGVGVPFCRPIDNYNNNNKYLKIYLTGACAQGETEIDNNQPLSSDLQALKAALLAGIRKRLEPHITRVSYEVFFKDFWVAHITDAYIVLGFGTESCAAVARKNYLPALEAAVNGAVSRKTA